MFTSKVKAGFPSPAEDHVQETLSADDYLVSNPTATFFVKAAGDSMIDAMIYDGDILVVDRSKDPQIGDIVLAEIDGGFTVKYLGHNKLIPANQNYEAITFKEGISVQVIGVITGSMRKFGR